LIFVIHLWFEDHFLPQNFFNDDVVEKQEEPLMDELVLDVNGSMDPLDPPTCDPYNSNKIPLWL